ncbi:hypothetical protein BH24ACT14_BH24ACT14_11250 [soil metagenome]
MGAGTNSTNPRRVEARLAAFRLVSEVQSRDDAAADLATARHEAEAQRWAEVERLLLYADVVRACWLSEADADRRIDELLERSERDGDEPLRAAGLAMRAEFGYREGNSEVDAARSDADLALATALLDMPHGPALERVSALISCACAYAERGLWELEEESYAKAMALLPLCEDPMPAQTVLHNRPFAHLYAACSLHEVGEVEQALEHCRRGVALVASALAADLPDDYAASVRAVRYLLAALAGDERPEPLDVILADTAPLLHQHSVGSVRLAEALRALRAGDVAAAQAHVGLAEPLLRFDPQSPELALAMLVAADAAAAVDPNSSAAALRYGQHNAQLRRQARLRLLGSARARLETERLRLERDAYARNALVDELTGVGNRHHYNRWLAQLCAKPTAERLAVLVVDIDRFKTVNDTHGHAAGDEVLRGVGRLLRASSRPADLVARLGGEEFVLLLGDVGAATAHDRALGLLDAIRAEPWHEVSPGARVSVSVGLATGFAHDAENLLRLADTALYQAKAAGRDGLVMIEPTAALASP